MSNDPSSLRHTLIAAATAMLAEGDGEISLRAVARAANVSAMAPYRHFPDKAALLGAVAMAGFDALRDRLLAADATGTARDRLAQQGIGYVAFAVESPALFRLMFAGSDVAKTADECSTTAYAVLARCVGQIGVEDPDTVALACWAMVHGIATLAIDSRVAVFDRAGTAATLAVLVSRL